MGLSSDLIREFAKQVVVEQSNKTQQVGSTVEGTAKLYDGKMYVQLDGSDGQLTPIASSTAGMKDGDRVLVTIKEHTAKVTGNVSSPSAGQSDIDQVQGAVDNVSDQISEFEIILADKVDTDQINAVNGRIDNLVSDNVTIKEKLTATEATIGKLEADNVTINDKLTAQDAEIENINAKMLTADVADLKYATITNLEATNADIHNLEADYGDFKVLTTEKFTAQDASIKNLETTKLDAESADIRYAKIDFANIGEAAVETLFAKSGIIGDLVVDEGHITGHLVGVTINGDLIEGNTIKADKLVVLGDDGLYYKLNVNGESVAAEQTEYNSLNGSIITANTITAEKINVSDLVAFNATIGGFHITDSSLYSGVKASVDNTTRGTYMDDTGQFAIGDQNNYLKFFLDETDNQWKLQISANSIKMGTSGTTIEDALQNNKISNKTCGDIVRIGANAGYKPIDLTVYGNTRQNLWMNPETRTSNGVTLTTNDNGSVTLSGTATANTWITTVNQYSVRPSTTYILSVDGVVSEGTPRVGFYVSEFASDGTETPHPINSGETSLAFTTKADCVRVIYGFLAYSGATASGTYRIMLNEGSEAEPWCPPGLNGVDELSIVTAGKNLNGVAEKIEQVKWASSTEPGWSEKRAGLLGLFNSLPEGEYTLSCKCRVESVAPESAADPGPNNQAGFLVRSSEDIFHPCTNITTVGVTQVGDVLEMVQPVEISPGTCMGRYDEFYIYSPGVGSGYRSISTFYDIQLELGSTATAYEPPAVTTTPIDLDGHSLNSLPDGTRDELTVDSTGTVTLTQRVGSVEIPTDADQVTWDNRIMFPSPNSADCTAYPQGLMCDVVPPRLIPNDVPSYCITTDNKYNYKAYVKVEGSTSAADACAKAGGGTILYKLETPQTIALPNISLPELPAAGATVWASAPVPAPSCVEWWTEEGKKVADAQQSADNAQNTANDAVSDAGENAAAIQATQSSIELLQRSISQMVTDENGTSLMTQTSDGWTFNIGGLQSDVEAAATGINEVKGDLSQIDSLVQQTKDLADDIAEKTAYMTLTQDSDGDPALELGNTASDFKIRITNTSIDFMEGTSRIAYLTNKQLYIQSSVVTDEMKIGATSGFVWKKRANGNMGLRWVSS